MLAGAARRRPSGRGRRARADAAFPGGARSSSARPSRTTTGASRPRRCKRSPAARLALRYELRDEEADAEPTGEPALTGEELVRRFMEEFDAEELDGEDRPARRRGEWLMPQPNMQQCSSRPRRCSRTCWPRRSSSRTRSSRPRPAAGWSPSRSPAISCVKSIKIDPAGGRPRGRRAAPGHGPGGRQRGAALRPGARAAQARRAHRRPRRPRRLSGLP